MSTVELFLCQSTGSATTRSRVAPRRRRPKLKMAKERGAVKSGNDRRIGREAAVDRKARLPEQGTFRKHDHHFIVCFFPKSFNVTEFF